MSPSLYSYNSLYIRMSHFNSESDQFIWSKCILTLPSYFWFLDFYQSTCIVGMQSRHYLMIFLRSMTVSFWETDACHDKLIFPWHILEWNSKELSRVKGNCKKIDSLNSCGAFFGSQTHLHLDNPNMLKQVTCKKHVELIVNGIY